MIQSDFLAGTNSLALSGTVQLVSAHFLNGLWTHSMQLNRPTYAPASRNYGLHPQYSMAMTHYF